MADEFVAKFISTLLASRDQAHVFHLQTRSYAVHKALNEYYDAVVNLIDEFVESYQGRYGILTGFKPATSFIETESSEDIVKYFVALNDFVDRSRERLPNDGFIMNQVDELSQLINSTLYKLTYLS
jgi:hypothetical protein